MSQRAFVRASVIVCLAQALLAPGCSPGDDLAALGGVSDECLINSDCGERLVCAFQRCHVECITTRDCDGTSRCVGAHELERVCQLEEEASCKTNADCVAGFTCSQDGACRDVCASDRECIGEQLCVKGVCAEPYELDDTGELPQVLAHRDCQLSSDCAEGSICAHGACLPECRSERDCALGETCTEGACRAPDPEPPCECHEDVDCNAGETCVACACRSGPAPDCVTNKDCDPGQRCVNGQCDDECKEDRDCPASRVCDTGACVPKPPLAIVKDAIIENAEDLALMRNVREVEGTLVLRSLSTTEGLEQLVTVGDLQLIYLAFDEGAPSVLSGLSNLKHIRGDLLFVSTRLPTIDLNPALVVDGSVTFQVSPAQIACGTIATFESQLRSGGFTGCLASSCADDCATSCNDGVCQQ